MAGNYQVVDKQYVQNAIQKVFPQRKWDYVADLEPDRVNAPANGKGAAAIYTVYDRPTVDTTTLPDLSGAASTQTPVAHNISVTMYQKGEKPEKISAAWEALMSFQPEMNRSIVRQAEAGITARNLMVAAAVLDGMPAAGNYTWDGTTYDVHTNQLVYLGSDTATEATRAGITTTDTLTDIKWIRRGVSNLRSRGIQEFSFPDGFVGYIGYLSPQLAIDFKAIAAANGGLARLDYTQSGHIINGYIGDFEGVRWIEDIFSIYKGLGSGSCHVHPMTIVGSSAIGIPFARVAQLPTPTEGMAFNVNEFMQIRVTPAPDTAGRLLYVGYYFYGGAGIIDPFGTYRQEFYATDQSLYALQDAYR